MGRKQSWDNAWDIYAMSNYSTITSLGESPVEDGILYVGTDDGLIQVTEDGGASWRKIEVGSIKGIPATAFVNDIRADLFDAGTVYAALDNHKYGDFKPYIIKSTNFGKSWQLISGNIDDRTLVWRLVQDHVRPELLFAATEFGIWFTINGGDEWVQLKGGLPTISFRDIQIQRRENDLVGASFGRGFFILDDITPLRELSEELIKTEDAYLFPVKDAWHYTPKRITIAPGAAEYRAENPPFGTILTYYLKDDLHSLKDARKKKEKELEEQKANIPFPGWRALQDEKDEDEPFLVVTIKDDEGNVVNHVKAPAKTGIHRVNWDLRYASKSGMDPEEGADKLQVQTRGFRVTPGTYSATLFSVKKGKAKQLAGPVMFNLNALYKGAIEPVSVEEIAAYRDRLEAFAIEYRMVTKALAEANDRVEVMKNACFRMDREADDLLEKVYTLEADVRKMDILLNGKSVKNEVGEKQDPRISDRYRSGISGLSTSHGPTEMHSESLKIAEVEIQAVKATLKTILNESIPDIEQKLRDAGAPLIEEL